MHLALDGSSPRIDPTAWTAPNAVLAGDVVVGESSSIWYGAVLRTESETISIGRRTNLQDGCIVHVDPGSPATLGDDVTVGHGAVLHGCTVGDGALIGMRATVLNGATIGAGSMVAAGAVVLEGTDVPPGSLVAGVPAKVRRPLTDDESARLLLAAANYVERSRLHAAGTPA